MEIRALNGELLAAGNSVKEILAEQTSARRSGRRGRASFIGADLRNLDLQDARIAASNDATSTRRSDFKGADFSGANLQGAELCGLDLRGAIFDGCNMRAFSLHMCDVRGARFNDCDIGRFTSEADRCGHVSYLQGGYWDDVVFTDCDMGGVMFSPKSAAGMVLKGCNIEDANLDGDFDGAIFSRCSLEDANAGKLFPGDDAARFGVALHSCNTTDLGVYGCPTVPRDIEESDLPDVADVSSWTGTWTGAKDRYLVAAQHARDAARHKMVDLWEVERAKALVEQNARIEANKAKMDAAIARARATESAYSSANGAALSEREIATSIAKAVRLAKKAVSLPPLTAAFDDPPPAGHAGAAFHARITFSRPLRVGWRTVLGQGFTVAGGSLARVRRVSGRSDIWELTIEPTTADSVVITTTDALVGSGGQSLAEPAIMTIGQNPGA